MLDKDVVLITLVSYKALLILIGLWALRQGQLIATTWYTVVFFGMCLVGFAGRLLVGDLENSELVFFAVNAELFPSALGAVLLAAVLSAIMSTADSMQLVTGTTVAHDLGITRRFRLAGFCPPSPPALSPR